MCLAILGRIISIDASDPLIRMARVEFGQVVKEICLAYTPQAKLDDYVLVHVGFSISILDSDRARQTLKDMKAICSLPNSRFTGEDV
ncbi:MAG: HypC/HybG/HupF family hydrogenase formation chaperone [Methylocystis sp.]